MNEQVTTQKLFEDLQTVVRDAEALLKATAGQAGDKIQEVRSRAEDSVRQARVRLESLQDEAIHRAKTAVGDAEGYVRSNPWQSVGIAAGVGLILGMLVSRR